MKKALKIIGWSVFGLLLAAYMAGTAYSRLRFWPGTTINGTDVGMMDAVEAEKALNRTAPVLSVIQKDAETLETFEEQISLKDVDYWATYETAAALMNQRHLSWPVYLFETPSITMTKTKFTYNKDKLQQEIAKLYCLQEENQVAPENAYLVGDGKNGVVIEEADDGCLVIESMVRELVNRAVEDESSAADLSGCYVYAERRSDDQIFQAMAKRTESIYNKTVSIHIVDDIWESFGMAELKKMVTINEDLTYTINEKAVLDYCRKLAEKYPTVKHRRGFLSSRGYVVAVGQSWDTYDYTFDPDRTVENILPVLTLIGDVSVESCWYRTAVMMEEDKDGNNIQTEYIQAGLNESEFGPGSETNGTYIEISIDDQTLWYYENGVMKIETDVVTGEKYVWDTPCGVYSVMNKSYGHNVLQGGAISDYWMGFIGGQYGIHDAYRWRSEYGGDIYEWDGSHGCVNTPLENVSVLFELADYGTPVIIYETSEGR